MKAGLKGPESDSAISSPVTFQLVAAFDRAEGQSAFITMAYIARAVTPGHYIYPPATAEDMYEPERYARTGFGELEVKAK